MAEVHQRVLVIEDISDVRHALQQCLEDEGYEVLTASDGASGLEAIRQSPYPDLVLLDVALPKMSGFDVLSEARRLGATTPIVMLTAHGEQQDILRGFELGADGYVTKPFSPDVLIARVHSILHRTKKRA